MEIRIYDYISNEFVPQLITYKAINIKYRVHAYEPSGFGFDFSLDEFGADEFKIKRFVLIENFIGVIENIKRNTDTNSNMMSVSGTDIKGLFINRIIIPQTFSGTQGTAGYDAVTGYTDVCIKHFWQNNIGTNAAVVRRYNFITIGGNKNIGKSNDAYKARYNKLSDVTAELAKGADLVVTVTPQIETGKILLDVVKPDMRTVTSERPLILSLDRLTVLQIENIIETLNKRNAFYTTRSGAQFADEALTMLYFRDGETEPSGIDRKEEHLNVSVNTPVAGNEYTEMRRQAVHDMVNYEEINSLNAKVNFTQLKYNRDFKVGDFVTVQNIKWGVEADIQIVAVDISETASDRTESVTLGAEKKGYVREILTQIQNI